jgi:phage N-6-adenine-methyltransferase
MNGGLFSSASNEWETPQELFNSLNAEFGFTLDPCSTPKNAKCAKFYTIDNDGLSKDWQGEIVFMNPPYGREIGKWIEKAYNSGTTCVSAIVVFRQHQIDSGVKLLADTLQKRML